MVATRSKRVLTTYESDPTQSRDDDKELSSTAKSGTPAVKKPSQPATKKSKTSATALAPANKVTAASEAQTAEENGERIWLMKAEPDTRMVKGIDVRFSVDDLAKAGQEPWSGVRNYEARNLMRDRMKLGDKVLFYHSNTKIPGIAGLATVAKESYPDYTAFDTKHPYYDEKSNRDDPRWFMVDVKFERKLDRFLSLKELQMYKDSDLKDMFLLTRGRLSVQPVRKEHFEFILSLEKQTPTEV